MLVIGDGSEHDLVNSECIIKKRVFVELAADTIDLIIVIRVSQVDLIWGDPNGGTCSALG
jgi:hypothetical protein